MHVEVGVSFEDQSTLDDVENGATNNVLHRYHVSVFRASYSSPTLDNYQVAALIRPIGFNDTHFDDHFTVGWGVSFVAGVYVIPTTDVIYFGAAGGSGVEQYIYGATQAAVITNGATISTLSEAGGFVPYQRLWYLSKNKSSSVISNVALGYVSEETVSASDNRHLEQVTCNIIWNVNANASVGLEYDYGDRVQADGQRGQDNRFQLIVQFGASGSKNAASPVNAAEFGAAAESSGPDTGSGPTRSRSLLGL
jgi:hypothetical protein